MLRQGRAPTAQSGGPNDEVSGRSPRPPAGSQTAASGRPRQTAPSHRGQLGLTRPDSRRTAFRDRLHRRRPIPLRSPREGEMACPSVANTPKRWTGGRMKAPPTVRRVGDPLRVVALRSSPIRTGPTAPHSRAPPPLAASRCSQDYDAAGDRNVVIPHGGCAPTTFDTVSPGRDSKEVATALAEVRSTVSSPASPGRRRPLCRCRRSGWIAPGPALS